MVGVIPASSVHRAILDVAARVSLGRLAWMIDQARVMRLATVESFLAYVDDVGARGWSGAARLRLLLEERRGEPEGMDSVREHDLHRLLVSRGFPAPAVHYLIHDRNDRVAAEADLAYPPAYLDLEYDGREAHDNDVARQADRERDAYLYSLGWLTLRASKETLLRPEKFLAAVRARLDEFGVQ
jgi:hypothetical protein